MTRVKYGKSQRIRKVGRDFSRGWIQLLIRDNKYTMMGSNSYGVLEDFLHIIEPCTLDAEASFHSKPRAPK